MKPKTKIFILMFVFLIFSTLLINKGIFHHDTAQTVISIEKFDKNFELTGGVNGKYVYVFLNYLFYILTPFDLIFSVNFFSVICATLNIYLIYRLFLKFRVNNAFMLTLLCATNPLYLSLATMGKSNMLMLTFFLGILLSKTEYKVLILFTLGIFVRTELLLVVPYFLYKKRWDTSIIMMLIALIRLRYVPLQSNEITLNIINLMTSFTSSIIYIIIIFNVALIISLLYHKGEIKKSFLVIILSIFIPLSLTNVSAPRFFLPMLPFVYYFMRNVNKRLIITCIIINLIIITPVLVYRHNHSNSKTLINFLEKNDVKNITFDRFHSDESIFVSYLSNITITPNASRILTILECNQTQYSYTIYENYHKAELRLQKKRVYLCDVN